MPILGIIASAKSGNLAPLAWDSIATYSGGAASSFTFNSIPSTYKYLRIVARLKDNRSINYSATRVSFNGVPTGSNYAWTWVFGDSRTNNALPFEDSTSGSNSIPLVTAGNDTIVTPGTYAYNILDIFDYQNTSKATTVLGFGGMVDNSTSAGIKNQVAFNINGTWADTSVVNSITFTADNPNYNGSIRVALYGIKG